ncbi:hypothetical protein HY991_04915 [Candidatus Micrarchaeota archaeon]|nr:hypothetical protein [Candidatus Micrarchaeota archaeon]
MEKRRAVWEILIASLTHGLGLAFPKRIAKAGLNWIVTGDALLSEEVKFAPSIRALATKVIGATTPSIQRPLDWLGLKESALWPKAVIAIQLGRCCLLRAISTMTVSRTNARFTRKLVVATMISKAASRAMVTTLLAGCFSALLTILTKQEQAVRMLAPLLEAITRECGVRF